MDSLFSGDLNPASLLEGIGGASEDTKIDESDDERPQSRPSRKVLQLSSLKVYAPSEGFQVLKEIYLTRSGATDNDLDKIAKVCQGLVTLDCSGCPRVGDIGAAALVPRLYKKERSGGRESLRGCPTLKNAYFYGTSLTDVGVRTLVASKLVASLKAVGVSSHVTKARVDEMTSRGIKVTGADGKALSSSRGITAGGSSAAGADSSLALFDAVPAAIAAAGTALTSGAWVADLQASFASLAAFWPSDEPPPPPSRAPSRTTRIS